MIRFYNEINWGDKKVRKDLDNLGFDALYNEKKKVIVLDNSSKFVKMHPDYWVEKLPESFMVLFNKYQKEIESEGGEIWMDAHRDTGYNIMIGVEE